MDFSQKIDREELREVFRRPFDPEIWKTLLLDVFGANKLYHEPRLRELDNGDNAKVQGYDLGEIVTPDKYTIGLFQFEIKEGHNIPMNRVGLRGLVEREIKYVYDAALVVYYNDKQWRLSFICDIKGEKTAPKRFTYVFGDPGQTYRTPIKNFELIKSKGASKDVIHEAFSVEQLNKEFFKGYKDQFRKFCDYLSAGREQTKQDRDYVKKLLGRLVFLQFLQKKGWMGVPAANKEWENGDPNYLQNLIAKNNKNESLLTEVLEPLFFATLNEKRPGDIADKKLGGNIKIPYLNGGLFDKDSLDAKKTDFPYSYFAELSDFFSAYNFTIDENAPDDSEVGIDPEMLGHIFENLLEDNKDKGAFYTPKEIVHYMCRESLVQYLRSHTGEELHKTIDELVREGKFTGNALEATKLNDLLREVKICDPAIGSGAFPMGLLSEIFHCRRILVAGQKNFPSSAAIKREIIQDNIYGVDIEQGAVDIARLRFWLSLVVDEPQPEPLPNLDYKIMQGNSLLESFEGEDLSVLYKDDEAVSDLFSVPRKRQDIIELQSRYFSTTNHAEKSKIKSEINEIIVSHLEKSLRQKKRLLNKQLEQTRTTIANFQAGIDGGGIPKGRIAEYQKRIDKESKALASLEVAKSELDNKSQRLKVISDDSRPFFLWHLFFKDVFEKGGFDIVIANPPYVSIKDIDKSELEEYKNIYKTAKGQTDLYALFIEAAISISNNDGVIAYIIPDTLNDRSNFTETRKILLKQTTLHSLLTLNRVFESATVGSTIFVARKGQSIAPVNFSKSEDSETFKQNVLTTIVIEQSSIYANENHCFLFVDEKKGKLLHKIDEGKKRLEEICYLGRGEEIGRKSNVILTSEVDDSKPFFSGGDFARYTVPAITKYIKVMDIRKPHDPLYGSKIVVRQVGNIITATYDYLGCVIPQSVYTIACENAEYEMEYLLALLNSSLFNYIYRHKYKTKEIFPRILLENLKSLPIAFASKNIRGSIVEKVEAIHRAKAANPAANTSALESEIDRMVYGLYGLTEEEIAIIENT